MVGFAQGVQAGVAAGSPVFQALLANRQLAFQQDRLDAILAQQSVDTALRRDALGIQSQSLGIAQKRAEQESKLRDMLFSLFDQVEDAERSFEREVRKTTGVSAGLRAPRLPQLTQPIGVLPGQVNAALADPMTSSLQGNFGTPSSASGVVEDLRARLARLQALPAQPVEAQPSPFSFLATADIIEQ